MLLSSNQPRSVYLVATLLLLSATAFLPRQHFLHQNAATTTTSTQLFYSPLHIASPEEVLKLFAKRNAVILDVRSQAEIDLQGLIQTHGRPWVQVGCTAMECPSLPSAARSLFHSHSMPIIVHCSTGSRAAKAKQILDDMGYTQVVNAGAFTDLDYLQKAADRNREESHAEATAEFLGARGMGGMNKPLDPGTFMVDHSPVRGDGYGGASFESYEETFEPMVGPRGQSYKKKEEAKVYKNNRPNEPAFIDVDIEGKSPGVEEEEEEEEQVKEELPTIDMTDVMEEATGPPMTTEEGNDSYSREIPDLRKGRAKAAPEKKPEKTDKQSLRDRIKAMTERLSNSFGMDDAEEEEKEEEDLPQQQNNEEPTTPTMHSPAQEEQPPAKEESTEPPIRMDVAELVEEEPPRNGQESNLDNGKAAPLIDPWNDIRQPQSPSSHNTAHQEHYNSLFSDNSNQIENMNAQGEITHHTPAEVLVDRNNNGHTVNPHHVEVEVETDPFFANNLEEEVWKDEAKPIPPLDPWADPTNFPPRAPVEPILGVQPLDHGLEMDPSSSLKGGVRDGISIDPKNVEVPVGGYVDGWGFTPGMDPMAVAELEEEIQEVLEEDNHESEVQEEEQLQHASINSPVDPADSFVAMDSSIDPWVEENKPQAYQHVKGVNSPDEPGQFFTRFNTMGP